MSTPILSIVGHSNAGKTTLLEKLVARLSAQGLRVATVKHCHHQPQLDQPGKDSWRHKQAGASTTFLVGPQQLAMVKNIDATPTPQDLLQQYGDDYDLMLVEGYSTLPGKKIEVLRAACQRSLRCPEQDLLAVVSDVNTLPKHLNVINLDDMDALVTLVCQWMEGGAFESPD
jgi:molybdopterin-guanine dinucleotide biosynthesis protein B